MLLPDTAVPIVHDNISRYALNHHVTQGVEIAAKQSGVWQTHPMKALSQHGVIGDEEIGYLLNRLRA